MQIGEREVGIIGPLSLLCISTRHVKTWHHIRTALQVSLDPLRARPFEPYPKH